MSWTTFLDSAPAADHAVQIYDDVGELAGSVARFLAAGFRVGEPAIVIATADHRRAFGRDLERLGIQIDELEQQGLFVHADAETTLDAFMVGDLPTHRLFEEVVGSVVDDVAARYPGKTIRAFGEMVDILWRRGNEPAAIALEELWNELAETRRFALLCGYHLDIFDIETQNSALPQIFRAHTHVRPAADTSRLATAVDKALAEVVGPFEAGRIYLQIAEQVPRSASPRAQAALIWLSGQRSAKAKQILDRVRTHYVSLREAASARAAAAAPSRG
jgi:MEDS: MEthanogen/methylotroph, DcmR Sensory domain